jgi:transcriptional regulator with XRE-family HTH domain
VPEHNDDQRPTVRRVLDNTLRRYRERAHMSLRELAAKTTYNHTYIGRVERGEQLPSDALAHTLDETFDTGGALFELLELARAGAIQPYSREGVAAEGAATRTQVFTSSLIPGLLQTEDYARALFRTANARGDGVEEAVAAA